MRVGVHGQLRELRGSIERLLYVSAAHVLKAYDGLRVTSASVAAAGFGTSEFSCRCVMTGLELAELLPGGLGEPSRREQASRDRIDAVKARRQEAVEAFERERLMKLQSEAERARIAREREERLKQQQAQEERAWYVKAERAYGAVTLESELPERKAVAGLWERLHNIMEERYPGTTKAVVANNNHCVVVARLLGDTQSAMLLAAENMRAAADHAMVNVYCAGSCIAGIT